MNEANHDDPWKTFDGKHDGVRAVTDTCEIDLPRDSSLIIMNAIKQDADVLIFEGTGKPQLEAILAMFGDDLELEWKLEVKP